MSIRLEHIQKHYGKKYIIKDLNIEFSNEFITFLGGPNFGKTTIIKTISGLDNNFKGKIYYNDRDITKWSTEKRRFSVIFEDYGLFEKFSVFDNISFGLEFENLKNKEKRKRVENILTLLEIKDIQDKKIEDISDSEKFAVALGRAIITEPKLVLLDNVLARFDSRIRKILQIELKKLQKSLNIPFILTTNDTTDALVLSDKLIVYYGGNIVQSGTPKEIYELPNSEYVAKFIGEANVFHGEVFKTSKEICLVKIDDNVIEFNRKDLKLGDKVCIILRPENVHLIKNTTRKLLKGKVIESYYSGPYTTTIVLWKNQKIYSLASNASKSFEINEEVYMDFDEERASVLRVLQ